MKRVIKLCGLGLILSISGVMFAGEGGLIAIESAGYIPRNAGGGFASEPVACQPDFIAALQRFCDDTPKCEFMTSLAFCRASFAPMEAKLSVSFRCRYASGDVEQHDNNELEADEWVSIQCD